jgi:hypothetical protein
MKAYIVNQLSIVSGLGLYELSMDYGVMYADLLQRTTLVSMIVLYLCM